jgi:hypothetical protein
MSLETGNNWFWRLITLSWTGFSGFALLLAVVGLCIEVMTGWRKAWDVVCDDMVKRAVEAAQSVEKGGKATGGTKI